MTLSRADRATLSSRPGPTTDATGCGGGSYIARKQEQALPVQQITTCNSKPDCSRSWGRARQLLAMAVGPSAVSGSLPITPRLESRHPLSDSPMPPPDGMHRPVALVGGCLSHNPLQISRRHRLNKSCERGEPQPCSPLWAKFTHPLAAAVSTNHPPPPSLPHSRRTTRAVLCHARIGARTWGPPPSPLNAGLHSLFLSCLAALALAWFAW